MNAPLSAEILKHIGGEHADVAQLKRAIAVAPALIGAAGILPIGRDIAMFGGAIDAVMGGKDKAESEEAYHTLCEIKPGIDPDLSALACTYMTAHEDAAYALGLAVGLTFANLLDRNAVPR